MVAPSISILLPDLRAGGAERLHLSLANEWLKRGISVEFVLLALKGELLASLPPDATVHSLDTARVRSAVRPLASYLRCKKPDALLAAMWPLTVIAPLAARLSGCRRRVVVSEHEPLSVAYAARGVAHDSTITISLAAAYRLADARVGVSSGVVDDMARLSRMARSQFAVAYNPAATGSVAASGYPCPSLLHDRAGPVVLSVGTLKAVKRHDLLIRAFSQLRQPGAVLVILGEGPERSSLEALIDSLSLRDKVILAGYQHVTAPWYAHADMFVLTSDHEGFGNVLVEALEHGLPVVSTDCPFGPREILEGGKFGALVPVGDVDALAKAMEDVLSSKHDRKALQRRAQNFSVAKATDAYLDLLLPGWRAHLVV